MRDVTVVQFDDGRFGIENEKNLETLTMQDLDKIVNVFLLWADLHAELIDKRMQEK